MPNLVQHDPLTAQDHVRHQGLSLTRTSSRERKTNDQLYQETQRRHGNLHSKGQDGHSTIRFTTNSAQRHNQTV